MLLALIIRDLRATLSDKGRLAELIVFPASFLVIWGLLLSSGIISKEVAASLLIINCIWSLSSSFQSHVNFPMMFDLWSGELPEMLRAGIGINVYLWARVGYSMVIGLGNLLVFIFVLPVFIGVDWQTTSLLLYTLPHYLLASLAIAFFVSGAVLRLGRSYAFLTWTAMQIVITFSSPFSPLDSLPTLLHYFSLALPYSLIFEFVRNPLGHVGNFSFLNLAFAQSCFYCFLGHLFYHQQFRMARALGRLAGH